MPMNSALYYHPEGFTTSNSRLMGRHAAGEGFLQGWTRHAGVDQLVCFSDNLNNARHFAKKVREFGWAGPTRWISSGSPHLLSDLGNLLLPGPGLDTYAWARRGLDSQRGFSVIGITHTTASASAMDNIGALLTAPVQEWDALICTSTAVRTMVLDLLATEADYLGRRLGVPRGTRFVVPQLPMIPLGVDTDLFIADAGKREKWRLELGIGELDCVVLFVGRLSFHAKAHPIPMYMALQAATDALPAGGRLHLIEAGWFANNEVRDAYASAADSYCPDVVRHVLDGRMPEVRHEIWQAADIFCSLSDNIQETFGLTPVEAMAAGLPCIVSDWDGYKETVRHGVDGLRVPTWLPPSYAGADLAHRHAMGADNYDYYCGKACQFTSVDPGAAASMFRTLISDPDLRRRMGAAGRARARDTYDWRVIITQYQTLFAELKQRREITKEESAPASPGLPHWPLRADPFRSFSHYPTHQLTLDCGVQAAAGASREKIEALYADPVVRYAGTALPPLDLISTLLADIVAKGPSLVAQLLAGVDSAVDRIHILRGLMFMAKYGLILLAAPAVSGDRS